MPDAASPELVDKAKRVVGMFVAMVGSGITLESSAVWTGMAIMLVGLAMLVRGLVQATPKTSWPVGKQESDPAPAARATESQP